MKLLLVVSLLLPVWFNEQARAQSRGDAATLNFINYDHRGDHAFEARTGAPPIRIGEKTMIITSVNARQIDLSDDKIPAGEDLKLSDYGASALLSTPWKKWTVTARVGANFANATPGLRIKRESTFYNGLLIGTRPLGQSAVWKYSLGVIVLGRGSRLPAVPALAFDYESEGQVYQVQIGFPTFQATYGFTQSFRVGIFGNFVSGSYLLPEDSALRAYGDYVGVDRIITGTIVRVRLSKLLWLNTRVGYSVYGKTTVLSGGLDERRRLDEESGLYTLIGLAVAIPRP